MIPLFGGLFLIDPFIEAIPKTTTVCLDRLTKRYIAYPTNIVLYSSYKKLSEKRVNPELADALGNKLLTLTDDEMILAHRNSELTGHRPILESSSFIHVNHSCMKDSCSEGDSLRNPYPLCLPWLYGFSASSSE
jgi:hypothetical protein